MAPSTTFEFPSFTDTIHRTVYPAIAPSNPLNSASGKVILITGGGAGIGKAIAKAFVVAGAKSIAIISRREEILRDAKEELQLAGSAEILCFNADVLQETSLDEVFATVKQQAGPIDVVVGNAGYLNAPGPAAEANLDDYFRAFEVNIKGTLITFRSFLKTKADKDPVFLSVNSVAAHETFPNYSAYSASKVGQWQLVSHLAAENPGVRVISMHPGVLDTEMKDKSRMQISSDDMSLPSGFAVWLASPAAKWLEGKFLWSHWDVDELQRLRQEVESDGLLRIGLKGWPRVERPTILV